MLFRSAYAIAAASDGNTIFHTHIPILDSNQETISQIELDIPVSVQRTVYTLDTEVEQDSTKEEPQNYHLFEKTKQEYKDEWYSTSQFMMLDTDETEFRKKYVFGFPDTKSEHHAGFMNDESHKDITAAQYGVLVHRVLEHINSWIENDEIGRAHV